MILKEKGNKLEMIKAARTKGLEKFHTRWMKMKMKMKALFHDYEPIY
jgi:hypothetical protein